MADAFIDWAYWSKFDALHVEDLAALTIGCNPEALDSEMQVDDKVQHDVGEEIFRINLAVAAGALTRVAGKTDPSPPYSSRDLISVAEFATWARGKGLAVGNRLAPPAIGLNVGPWIDPKHPNYSEELRAAIHAFEELLASGSPLPGHRGPKEHIERWLRDHYPTLSNAARERISTLINPNKEGGAPRTGN